MSNKDQTSNHQPTNEMADARLEKKVAPDGGWGYMIVIAFALSNIVGIPVVQNFGLLFRDIFIELDFTATDISTIITVNSAAGMMYGLLNGPFLKKFGYRKYAFFGVFLTSSGFIVTALSTTLLEFIIFYGIIYSIGLNIIIASFSLALNTYFLKKRSKATGFTSTLTGLGPVFIPLVLSKGIEYYSARGTAILLAGMVLHSFIAAMLLQPVKWHYKIIKEEPELEPLKELDDSTKENGSSPLALNISDDRRMTDDNENVDLDQQALDKDMETPTHYLEGVSFPRRVSLVGELGRRDLYQSRISLYDRDVVVEADMKWWSSKGSLTEDRRASISRRRRTTSTSCIELAEISKEIANGKKDIGEQAVPKEVPKTFCSQVIKWFDLDLLKDPIYTNISVGMSIAFTGEMNFSLMTPIILGDRKFDIHDTAMIMSTIATADIVFRFFSPFIGDCLKLSARKMYMIALVMLVISRFSLTCVESYWATIIVAVSLGVAKGFRTVYMTLVIPNYVPLEKLASASGLQTVLNGIILFAFGPLIGVLRDVFGTYDVAIHLTNFMSIVTVVIWSVEMFIIWSRKKSKENEVLA